MKESLGVRKGAWCRQEDELLKACIQKYGEGKWHLVPQRAGLNRCRKSCRMRWLNYLKPNIKRGDFAEDEIDMIKRFHKLLGNRWSLIAGRLPGRTSNDVKNYWNSYIRKKGLHPKEDIEKPENKIKTHVVIKPQPRTLSRNLPSLREKPIAVTDDTNGEKECAAQPCPASPPQQSKNSTEWWEILLNDKGDGEDSSWFLDEQEENVFLDHWDGNLFVKSQSLDDFP